MQSLNGVFVNGKQLEPNRLCTLNENDTIQFGVAKSGEDVAEFVYKFHYKIKVKRSRPKSYDEHDSSTQTSEKNYPFKKVKLSNCDNISSIKPSCSKENVQKIQQPFDDYKEKLKKQKEEANSKLKEFESKLEEMQRMLKEKEEEHERMRVRLEEEKQERENQTLQMKEKLKEKESQLEIQTSSMRERLKEKEQELAAEVMKREVIKSCMTYMQKEMMLLYLIHLLKLFHRNVCALNMPFFITLKQFLTCLSYD